MNKIYDNVRLDNVIAMLRLLSDTELRRMDYLQRRFCERGTHFDNTLAFLHECGIVTHNQSGLLTNCHDPELLSERSGFAKWFMHEMGASSGPIQDALFEYIGKYSVRENKVIYRPSDRERGTDSSLRNLLMDLGVISYESRRDEYELHGNQMSLYLRAIRSTSSLKPSQFVITMKAKEDIGLYAEKAVVQYERDRLGKAYSHHVEHIALNDVAAGYDVDSVTIQDGNRVVPRLIEVKAVRAMDYRFYWTRNEVEMARTTGAWYYLYLLPIARDGSALIDRMLMICDPLMVVMRGCGEWVVQDDVVECRLNTKDAGSHEDDT